jgi:serine O-acetyltransferase
MNKDIITKVSDELCKGGYKSRPMPSLTELSEVMELIRSVLFPGYFGSTDLTSPSRHFYMSATLDIIANRLKEQVLRGYCFFCEKDECDDCENKPEEVVDKFIQSLPKIRHLLQTDALAAYEGDPAARAESETIFCYPSIRALINHRVGHELYKLGVPLIPRIMSESAHSETGIDIHPGAEIGEKFFMDHGTGIVIGETTVIGKNVRLYQGVTLGAKSFPLDKDGHPIKGIARHPIVEDDVIIYAGATILGRINVGKGSVIGGNTWITDPVPAGSKVQK